MSHGEELVEAWLKDEGVSYVTQYRFHPVRRWRFDFAVKNPWVMCDRDVCVQHGFAIEVEGGQFIGGHKRGKAADTDLEKFNEAALMGWRVLRFSTGQVERGEAWPVIRRAADLSAVLP